MKNENQLVFDHAIRTANILVEMFGSNCEVAVHDFSNLEKSLIHLAGTLTDREIGSPITDLVLEQLRSENVTDFANYKTTSNKGLVMKSSTVFLKNNQGEVIGALCININISLLVQVGGEIQDFISFNDEEQSKESFHTDVHDVIESMTKQALQKYHKTPTLLDTEEKIEVVRELESKGAFLIKGATEYSASVLGVSKFTIYNYLQKIRTETNFNYN
ncbi:PAS domain-containing protein [Lentibacillus sp. N15]|uniref:helix-turn-helix transcriptional regulator n=1 Tax=Lentibacillus songyuanensis TaxID=3136161 RepID=UPI0031BAF1B7